MKNLIKNEQSGRSMVEMLGVLAIIGVLSVGGIAGYSKAMAKFKLSKTTDQISMIVANVRTIFASQPSYDGLDNANSITLGLVPQEMVNGANISNSFQGAVTLEATKSDGTTAANAAESTHFSITFANLDRESCSTLATSDWGTGTSSGLQQIEINGGTAFTQGGTAPQALPITPVAAATAGIGCDADINDIKWTYF